MVRIVSTYRLQFHKQFPLAAALELVPYLKRLGISHIYASPLLQTRAGSLHGYDVIDPTRLNEELGTEEDLSALCARLREHGMGLILDIVPNHMALSGENPWWSDVLRHGAPSRYARFFDLPGLNGAAEASRIVLPVLGTPARELIEKGELAVVLTERGLMIKYWDLHLPLALRSYEAILKTYCDGLTRAGGSNANELCGRFEIWRQRLKELGAPSAPAEGAVLEMAEQDAYEIEAIHKDLYAIVERQSGTDAGTPAFQAVLDALNANADEMLRILEEQYYELTDFQSGLARINYRRFFDVNELGGLRVEEPPVFEATHRKTLEWVGEGKIDGLRVDHIDGLARPAEYLEQVDKEIRARKGDRGEEANYILVEKILTGRETLTTAWPVAGTTGYETIHALRPVQVTADGLHQIEAIYQEFTGRRETFEEVVVAQKRRVLTYLFGAETRSLAGELRALAGASGVELSEDSVQAALVEFTAFLPVYRTYVEDAAITDTDRGRIELAHASAQPGLASDGERRALDFLKRVVLLDHPGDAQREAWLAFVRRWQQYTGPAMAKGLEDTAFYIHMPLLPLNEVGSGPDFDGLDLGALHAHNREKQQHHARGMNALSTHDTKRSEDARARVNVLAEMPARWREKLWAWHEANKKYKTMLGAAEIPDRNEEYMLYQTLLGELALGGETPRIVERMQQFATKALREGKVHSTWYEVHADYEQAVHRFIDQFMRLGGATCLADIRAFEQELAFFGAINSLVQVVLKNTMPGVPDMFQGQEMFDFSLVDPDNRHQVNFAMRARLLEEMLEQAQPDLSELMRTWRDGRIKMFVTQRTLAARAERPDVYLTGEYIALAADGERRDNVFAFARRFGKQWEVICVPRQTTQLVQPGKWPLGEEIWGGTRLLLPEGAPGEWVNLLGGEATKVRSGGKPVGFELSEVFSAFPAALLRSA